MKKLIVLILTVVLLGCSTLKSIEDIHDTSLMVANGEVVHEIKAIDLSSTNLAIVDHSINKLKIFIEKWDKVENIDNLEEFIAEYKDAKSNYLAIQRVITTNYDKYPKELQTKFLKYQKNAQNLDNTVQKLILGKNIYAATKVGVKLAMLAVGALK